MAANNDTQLAIASGEGAGEAVGKKKLSGKQLVLFVVLPALVVLGGGVATYFLVLKKRTRAAKKRVETVS